MPSLTDFNKKASNGQSLHIYLTEHCNLECRHCFLSASPHKRKSLSWSQIKTLLDYYRQNGATSVNFSGGEALTSPFLKDAINHACKIGYKNITIATNGTSSAIFDLPHKKYLQLYFSLDGLTPKTNDFIRGPGSFTKTIANIKKAIRLGYPVFVNYTVNRTNRLEVIPLIRYLDKLKVSTIGFNFLSLKGRAQTNRRLSITPRQWRRIYDQVISLQDLKYTTIRIPPSFLTLKEIQSLDPKDIHCLLFSPTRIEATPSGQLFHCCLLINKDKYKSGQILDNQIILSPQSELSLLKQYGTKAYCPARLMEFPDLTIDTASSRQLIPICFYYRKVVKPQKTR
jgi:MoaA/NifB/PqqE/SkfB family radical SAM enzyme